MLDMQLYKIRNRALIRVAGLDALRFLQNLVTNDLNVVAGTLIYSALLSPQGKYLFDFFILKEADSSFLIDIPQVALFRMGKRFRVAEHHFCQPGAPRVRHGRGPAVFRALRRPRTADPRPVRAPG